jgi:hypothetical protein
VEFEGKKREREREGEGGGSTSETESVSNDWGSRSSVEIGLDLISCCVVQPNSR